MMRAHYIHCFSKLSSTTEKTHAKSAPRNMNSIVFLYGLGSNVPIYGLYTCAGTSRYSQNIIVRTTNHGMSNPTSFARLTFTKSPPIDYFKIPLKRF